tara:strand:+ start:574 stop:753 length:180 start_codon:yes stop_codon:yes gene_type:complete
MNTVKVLQEELSILNDRREPHTSKSTHSTWVYLTGRIKEINKQIEENRNMDEPIEANDG